MGFRVRKLSADDPPDNFPEPTDTGLALGYPDGLVAIGGDLSVPRLLAAYRRGIFPWYNDDQPILWWCPEPRAVLLPRQFHMARSLCRELRRGHWQYSVNADFAGVIDGCATNRGPHGTWITPAMRQAYVRMHAAGWAHSIEAWHDGELAGGLYGVRLGDVFFAESMYSRRTSGSKVALSALVWLARAEQIRLIDCQLESDHLRTFGMSTMARADFLAVLPNLTRTAAALPDWHLSPVTASPLAALRAASTC